MTSGVLSYVWTAHHFATTVTAWHAAPSLLLIGSGMGLLVAPLTGMILIDVPPHEAGAASGIINATGQLGAAVGVALIGGLFFSQGLGKFAGKQTFGVVWGFQWGCVARF
jgi:predicted MFS family arabinose efflux permease